MTFVEGDQVYIAPHTGEKSWEGFLVLYSDGLKAIGQENLVCSHSEYWTKKETLNE